MFNEQFCSGNLKIDIHPQTIVAGFIIMAQIQQF